MAMPTSFLDMVVDLQVWRLMGFGSSVIGFTCFALGSSFQKLFGRWTLMKIVVYCILASMFSLFILSANRFRRPKFPRVFLLKVLVNFLVLLFTSLYSYYDDRGNKEGEPEGKGQRNILSLISFGSFALMSMSLSIQVKPGFEVGMSNFFLGCLVLGVVKKNFLEGLGVAVLCFMLMSIRSYSDFRQEQRRRGGVKLEDITVVGDRGLLEKTPQILSILPPLTVNPSSLSTLRRRRQMALNWLSDTLTSHLDVKKLKDMDLSPTEYLTSSRSERDLAKTLKDCRVTVHVRM